jgi:tagatose 6-phosphate kinase
MTLSFGTTPAISRTMRFAELRTGEVNRAYEVYTYAAGKAVNAARAIATLGVEGICMGVQGGMFGPGLLSLLERDRIGHRFLKVSAPTRLVMTTIDDSGPTATELIEDAPPMSLADGEALLQEFESRLDGTGVAVLSGSLARGLNTDYYARCIRIARERGVRVILDASGEPLRRAVETKPDVIKVNAHELAALERAKVFRNEPELLECARAVARQTEGRVIVTRGGDSTIAVDQDGSALRVEPLKTERVVSPIGSGDSFAAGVAVALSRRESFQQMLTLGTACAVANVETPHAAHFEADAVKCWRAKVQVRKLA